MSAFNRTNFPGYTRDPEPVYTRPVYTRPVYTRPEYNRRTSGVKKVTFKNPSPTKRTSRKRTPRSNILHQVKKGFKRMSPSRIKNKRAREVAEFIQALSPALLSALALYLYTIYKHTEEEEEA